MQGQKNLNGVNVDQLFATLDRLKQNPDMAKFRFRAKNKWIQGTHTRANTNGFYGLRKEDRSRDPTVFDLDEPPALLGRNQGANPLEYLLLALSGCLTTSLIAHAAAKGIEVKGVQSWCEGDLDLRGFLGISADVPVGYQNIRAYFKIDGNLSEQQKEELVQMAQQYSPVFNTLAKAAQISVQLDR